MKNGQRCGISCLRSKSDFRSPAVPNWISFGPPWRFSLPKSCSSNFSLHHGLFNGQKQAFWTDFRPFLDEKSVIFLLFLRYFYVMLMFLCCFLFLHEFSACSMVVRSEKHRLTANVKLHIVAYRGWAVAMAVPSRRWRLNTMKVWPKIGPETI